ncbi:MAG: FAD binding domain-containing protein [Nocardioidaceae bacterium]
MKPAPFDYHRPSSVAEAAEMLATTGGKVLAGGQSLVPIMSMRLASPTALVDLNHIAGLSDIEVTDGGVRIGALTRHSALLADDRAYAANPLLRRALRTVAHATIRNRGTTVGSLVHADPAAEMPAVLTLLGGSVEAVSTSRGSRHIPACDFFVGAMESALDGDEVAVAATFANPPPQSGSSWVELARRNGDYALVGVGALVGLDADSRLESVRVSLVSVGEVPVVVDLSEQLASTAYAEVDWHAADDAVDSAIDPEDDVQASADYRRHLAGALTRQALAAALDDAVEKVAA